MNKDLNKVYKKIVKTHECYKSAALAFAKTPEFKQFMHLKEEADKAFEELEKSEEWKAYMALDQENALNSKREPVETALTNSELYLDYANKKSALFAADPKILEPLIDHEKASRAYQKVWESTKDHSKALEEYYRSINTDMNKSRYPDAPVFKLETPHEAYQRLKGKR